MDAKLIGFGVRYEKNIYYVHLIPLKMPTNVTHFGLNHNILFPFCTVEK